MLVHKLDESFYFCVDFSKVNTSQQYYSYLKHCVNEILHWLGMACSYFTKGYWQILLPPKSSKKGSDLF